MPNLVLTDNQAFPAGTTVSAYAGKGRVAGRRKPTGTVITSAVVAAGGSVTLTGLVTGEKYQLYEPTTDRVVQATLTSVHDPGTAIGTGDTSNGTSTVLNAAATSGAFQAGQRIAGPGIPAGTRIQSISGATLTLSAPSTATATGVAISASEGYSWRAKVRRRRVAIGTS